MSRQEKIDRKRGLAIAWGKDHACGWFVQVWQVPATPDPIEDQPDDENILIDLDGRFDALSACAMVAIAREHGFEIEAEVAGSVE